MRTRVLIYCRVSRKEQVERGVSLEVQEARCREFCRLHDLDVVEVITDPGVSAKNLNRPGLTVGLEMLDKKKADGIVITKLDRLTRELADWQYLLRGFFNKKAGRKLYAVDDHVAVRTAMDRMLLNIRVAISQGERELIAERTQESLSFKRESGQRVGAVMYGFDLDEDGKSLVENQGEQGVIRTMHEMREVGHSYKSIAETLNTGGVVAKNGGSWSPTVVRRILKRAS